jgi:hypothetical protein
MEIGDTYQIANFLDTIPESLHGALCEIYNVLDDNHVALCNLRSIDGKIMRGYGHPSCEKRYLKKYERREVKLVKIGCIEL